MKRLIPIASVVVAAAASTPFAAPDIPIRTLAPARAVSRDTFGTILSIRHLPEGRVLVNDGTRRRVVLVDSTLTNPVVVLDSAGGSAKAYGPRPVPFIQYLGDSVLFADVAAQVLVIIDPAGKVGRTIAPPNGRDLPAMISGNAAVDPSGRLVYRVPLRITTTLPGGGTSSTSNPDSAVIVRADFVNRTVDTLALMRTSTGRRLQILPPAASGERIARTTVNPLPQLDDWAVLSTGDIALIRGSDYHVDWIRADGSKASTPKMTFDWRKLTDDDKQRLIDSARKAFADMQAAAPPPGAAGSGGRGDGGGGGGVMAVGAARSSGGGDGGPAPAPVQLKMETEFVGPSEIVDYYPPIRSGAAKADRDGNVWILTATSAQSQKGELVYDVVNAKGELFQRVRLPVGRSVAGFGPGGVVYLMNGALGKGFVLERTFINKAS
jgi:hypothetical protein